MIIEETRKVPIIEVIRYCFVVFDEDKDFEERFKHVNFHESFNVENFSGGFFEENDVFYICVRHESINNHGIIAHEVKHFINRLFIKIGYVIEQDNDELECYFITYFVNKFHEFLKRKINKQQLWKD